MKAAGKENLKYCKKKVLLKNWYFLGLQHFVEGVAGKIQAHVESIFSA